VTGIGNLGLPTLWLGAIVAAEILGRRSPSDVWDAIGVFVFGALVAVTIPRVTDCRLAITTRLRGAIRKLGRRALALWPEMGVDIRGEPPIPRGFPNIMLGLAFGIAMIAGCVFWLRSAFPAPARETLLAISPTILFLLLGLYWTGLLGLFGFSALSTWRDMNDHVVDAGFPSGKRDGVRLAVAIAWLGLIAALAFLVPIRFAWMLCGGAGAVGFFAAWTIDRYEKLRILWRAGPGAEPRIFYAGAGVRWDAFVMACLVPLLTIPGTGVGRAGAMVDTVPITLGLAAAAAWAAAIAFMSYTLHGPVRAYLLARHDPARREPIPLLTEGQALLSDTTRRQLATHGFLCISVDEGSRVGPAVRVVVDDFAPPRALQRLDREADFLLLAPRVRVSPESLTSLSTLAELRRLDHALIRDQLAHGIHQVLKGASVRRFHNGTGFWLAPHLWYVRGLTRDSDDPDYHTIGRPYHRILPRRSRQHVHRVFTAAEIDLVFAEDGVRMDLIQSVFDRLFDVYDVLGPGRVEEVSFVGLQSVRVIVHDFTLGEPFRRAGYREPSYEEIGRARILHIMLERGDGDEEKEPVPDAPEREPTLIGL